VLDSKLRLPLDSKLVQSAPETPVWVLTAADAAPEREKALVDRGVEVFRIEGGALALPACLTLLAGRGITRLMVEGGPILAASFADADLIDELVLLRGPNPIGADGLDAIEGQSLDALVGSPRLHRIAMESLGADTIETFERPCSPGS